MDMAEKVAAETVAYVFDFTDELEDGESISGTPTLSQTEGGETSTGLTFGTPSLSSPRVTVTVAGGTKGEIYVVSCTCTATGGQTLIVRGGIVIT